jgi:FtsH-binding integral membrane protein
MIVGVYLQSSMFDLAVSGCAVLVFSGFTLLDLNKLELYSVCSHTIFDVLDSALNLYLDFINLFLNLARLLSGNDKD